ncbi:MAG: beta family protein [Bauldia sp.]|nr:beta family protein [Bradyrhizobium sp.]MCW5713376.1 beta family protein [Bauldia sp.]
MIDGYLYVPAFRLKEGERMAVESADAAVRSRILPQLVVPPPSEPDPKRPKRSLTSDELIFEAARRLGDFWPRGSALFDWRYLLPSLEASESSSLLERLVHLALDRNDGFIPVLDLRTPIDRARALVGAVERRAVALRVDLEDSSSSDVGGNIGRVLDQLSLDPACVTLLCDFSDADLQHTEEFADFLAGYFEALSDKSFSRVVFQASSFPTVNPAKPGGTATPARYEWLAWQRARSISEGFAAGVLFGDFVADSSKFIFGKGRAPIAHLRYTRDVDWLIERGTDRSDIRSVAKRVSSDRGFSGAEFSVGDRFIYECATGSGRPGGASTWRMANTSHHITKQVRDIATKVGLELKFKRVEPAREQLALFKDSEIV